MSPTHLGPVARLAVLTLTLAAAPVTASAQYGGYEGFRELPLPPHAPFTPRSIQPEIVGRGFVPRSAEEVSDSALLAQGFIKIAEFLFSDSLTKWLEDYVTSEAQRLGGDLVLLGYESRKKSEHCGAPEFAGRFGDRTIERVTCTSTAAFKATFGTVWRRDPALARAERDRQRRPALIGALVVASDTAGLRVLIRESGGEVSEDSIWVVALAVGRENVGRWAMEVRRDVPDPYRLTQAAQAGWTNSFRVLFDRFGATAQANQLLLAAIGCVGCGWHMQEHFYEGRSARRPGLGPEAQRLEIIRFLLAGRASAREPVPMETGAPTLPLAAAAAVAFADAVDLLLAGGADPNRVMHYDSKTHLKGYPSTALGWALFDEAAAPQRARIVRTLVARGADPELKGEYGASAREVAERMVRWDRKKNGGARWAGADTVAYRLLGLKKW